MFEGPLCICMHMCFLMHVVYYSFDPNVTSIFSLYLFNLLLWKLLPFSPEKPQWRMQSLVRNFVPLPMELAVLVTINITIGTNAFASVCPFFVCRNQNSFGKKINLEFFKQIFFGVKSWKQYLKYEYFRVKHLVCRL